MEDTRDFGRCSKCGRRLAPVWFIEEERVVIHGTLCATGRKRRACSHLVCEDCLCNEVVDDSFDGPWMR